MNFKKNNFISFMAFIITFNIAVWLLGFSLWAVIRAGYGGTLIDRYTFFQMIIEYLRSAPIFDYVIPYGCLMFGLGMVFMTIISWCYEEKDPPRWMYIVYNFICNVWEKIIAIFKNDEKS